MRRGAVSIPHGHHDANVNRPTANERDRRLTSCISFRRSQSLTECLDRLLEQRRTESVS